VAILRAIAGGGPDLGIDPGAQFGAGGGAGSGHDWRWTGAAARGAGQQKDQGKLSHRHIIAWRAAAVKCDSIRPALAILLQTMFRCSPTAFLANNIDLRRMCCLLVFNIAHFSDIEKKIALEKFPQYNTLHYG
jgi:hypothetical protein